MRPPGHPSYLSSTFILRGQPAPGPRGWLQTNAPAEKTPLNSRCFFWGGGGIFFSARSFAVPRANPPEKREMSNPYQLCRPAATRVEKSGQ